MKKYLQNIKTIIISLFIISPYIFATDAIADNIANEVIYIEPPFLQKAIASKILPTIKDRLPQEPQMVDVEKLGLKSGQYGGIIRMAMAKSKDTRQMTVYGYARLVKYDRNYQLNADILKSIDIEDGRIFTMKLRKSHKWSDGRPFTSEDFRYWWHDIANDTALYPAGAPAALKLNGELPKVEIIDELTVRYSWSKANPNFLPLLAKASPRYIYAPAHYLKQFHQKYQNKVKLQTLIDDASAKNWSALHNKMSKSYKNTNPDLPNLQPWILQPSKTKKRFIFNRNPFFHKIDNNGRQLPYVDQWIFNITEKKLIPLKAATGEVSLQARYLKFKDISLLKQSGAKYSFQTHLWRNGKGADLALYPNLTHKSPIWRQILRDQRFRRALSLSIDRHAINKVLYYGMGLEGQNTLLPASPLYKKDYRYNYSEFDIAKANDLLDDMGMIKRNDQNIRLMPNGEPLEVIIETADSSSQQSDMLEFITDDWRKIGIKLHIKPTSYDILIPRIFAGETVMSIFSGWENGMANADNAPDDLALIHQDHYQWSKWGQYYETNGKSGEKIDIPAAQNLFDLYIQWYDSQDEVKKSAIWHKMLKIHSDNLFTIGIIAGTLQPVVVINGLNNIPEKAIWNWDPGAHFGIYSPDLFWFDLANKTTEAE